MVPDVTKYSREVTKMKKIVSVILTLALALGLALRSYADKLACQRVLDLLQEKKEPAEKPKK